MTSRDSASSIVFPLALFGYAGVTNYRSAWTGADERLERTLDVLQEHALKVFETVDLAIEATTETARGYNPLLEAFVGPVLRTCLKNKIRIVSNFGAANPQGAAMRICEMAQALGFPGILVAVVEGDDLTGALSPQEFAARETGGSLLADGPAIVAANVYLGAAPIAEGLSG